MADQEITSELNEEVATSTLMLEKQNKNQKIIDDYYAFFTGKKVDMLPYVYKESSDAYSALIHSPEYYLFRDEVNVINHNQDALKEHLAGVTDIIEIGPGCDYTVEKKTVPILNCARDLERYHAIDYSENFLHEACNSVLSRRGDIEVCGIKADLMNGRIDIGDVSGGKKCVLFLGSTLGNFTETQQVYAVNQIAYIMQQNDVFIFGADFNSDCHTILSAYSNEADNRLMLNILRCLKNIKPELAKCVENFKVEYLWNEVEKCINAYFIATNNQYLEFSTNCTVHIRKGQKFYLASSRKFNEEKIMTILNKKFDLLKTLDYSSMVKMFISNKI